MYTREINMSYEVRETDANRLNFKVTYQEFKDYDSEIKAEIQSVKKYGRIWGKILTAFGFASKIEGDYYVNTRSFFKHLVEAWCRTHGKENIVKNQELINKMAKSIEKDKDLDKQFLYNEKIVKILMDCNIKYVTPDILGTKANMKDQFNNL